jgi:hypothetical protein
MNNERETKVRTREEGDDALMDETSFKRLKKKVCEWN